MAFENFIAKNKNDPKKVKNLFLIDKIQKKGQPMVNWN